MKFYLVCTVPRLGFRMTALGDSMDVADACFAYETAVGKEIYIIKKICALCVCVTKSLDSSDFAAVQSPGRSFQGEIHFQRSLSDIIDTY